MIATATGVTWQTHDGRSAIGIYKYSVNVSPACPHKMEPKLVHNHLTRQTLLKSKVTLRSQKRINLASDSQCVNDVDVGSTSRPDMLLSDQQQWRHGVVTDGQVVGLLVHRRTAAHILAKKVNYVHLQTTCTRIFVHVHVCFCTEICVLKSYYIPTQNSVLTPM